jgi:hypothetical protein
MLGMADISFKNYDQYFSPYGSSAIAANILPGRPVRLYAGYRQLLEQVFVGQTMRLPESTAERATFHAKDFIGSFADAEITDGRIYVNQTTDAIIDDILQTDAGLSPTQYALDAGDNTIGFAHIQPGAKIGKVIRDLMQAELGRLYQDSDGAIYFKNRTNKQRQTAIKLREGYVYHEVEPDESNVINRVKISSDVREVQASQQVYPRLKDGSLTDYEDFSSIEVAAGEYVDKFFDMADPVTSYSVANYTANTASDGTGTNVTGSVPYTIEAEFTNSIKVRFTNNTAATAYVTAFEVDGTPAKVVEQIRVDVQDATSIAKYGEQLLEIDNDFFTDRAFAETVATTIVTENKDAPSIRELTIKGLPYLAAGDIVEHYDGDDYVVDAIDGRHNPGDGHTQTIRMRKIA